MDAELVNTIVQQVVAMLRQQGLTVPASAGPVASAAPSTALPRPAVRVTVGSAGNLPLDKPFVTGPAANLKKRLADGPRKVFITAEMLAQRLGINGASGTLELAPHEFLTPAAQDLVERRHVTIRKVPVELPKAAVAASPAGASPAAPAACPAVAPVQAAASPAVAGGAIGVVLFEPDTKVQLLLSGLQQDRGNLLSFDQTDCWMQNLRLLGEAIAAGRVSAGLAVLPYGADAMVLAGKLRGVRPVQGTSQASVAAAVRHYGANLLVLEHAFNTPHQMRSMVREFTAARRAAIHQPLMTLLGELEGR